MTRRYAHPRPPTAVALLVCVVALAPLADALPMRHAAQVRTSDPQQDCDELVPAAQSLNGVTDSGQQVPVDVLALVDSVSEASARDTFAKAAESYASLKLQLRVVAYRRVRFPVDGTIDGQPTRELGALMADVKNAVGGERPPGVDVVVALTNKRLYFKGPDGRPGYSTPGMADCIGGVRYADRSFAFAQGYAGRREWSADQAAFTITHEIGHLLGAHHHYGNCVEGGPPPATCTVMFGPMVTYRDAVNVNSRRFGTLEGAVVRGHAVAYASR